MTGAAKLLAHGLLVAAVLAWPSILAAQPSPSPPPLETLLGDAGGVRPFLGRYGISLGLQNVSELLGNPNGGRAQGVTFDGQNQLSLGIDLDKAVGLKGGIFNVSAYQNYGHGLSASNIDNLNLVSSIEVRRSAWLYELWYQQSFFGGTVDVRLGQLGADQEFMISTNASWFVNAAFGWPTLPSVDLPAGGPSVPLATPGVRVRVSPGPFTILAAVFNGDPAGPGLGNPQRRDSSGILFRTSDGVFAIAELQYAINGGKDAHGPPVTLKAGGWYHDKARTNQFFANDGLTATPAAGSSIAVEDWSAYAVADMMLLPAPSGKGGLAAFARAAAAPLRRNAVGTEFAAGLVYQAPFGREGDQVGLAFTTVRVGQPVAGGPPTKFIHHGRETVLELSYQAQVLPWLQVQPDAQYVITPSGGIPNPNVPTRRVGSAAIFGVRLTAAL